MAVPPTAGLEADLAAYLRGLAGRPFEWGICDCFLVAADWMLRRGWPDPAEPYRGQYRTERRAQRHIVKAGGSLLSLVSHRMEAIGVPMTDTPRIGDVALVAALNGPTLFISLGEHWAGKAEFGLEIGRADVIRAWGVSCR